MTWPLPIHGSIAASNGSASGILDSSDPLNPNRQNRRHENYEITGILPGKAIEVSLEASFDAYLEIVDINSGVVVAEDDQSGGGNNSRLSFLPAPGISYLARATTYFQGETGSFTLTTRLVDPADLQVIAATAPSSTSIGTLLNLSWTTKNNGPGEAASEWSDSIYLSSDSTFDADDIYITAFWPESDGETNSPLGIGNSRIRNLTFSAPSVSSAGLYYIIIRSDDELNQVETDEANNTFAIPITYDVNGPDLKITSASAPATASVGSNITLSWTVKNDGLVTASERWWDGIYLSTDPTYDSNDVGIWTFGAHQFSPLAAGSSYTQTSNISAPRVSAAGQYYLIIRTNEDSEQPETNESNNTFSLPISIDLNGPDLQIFSASAPATASIGGNISLSWTVKNNGLAATSSDWWDNIYLSTDASYDSDDIYIGNSSANNFLPLAAESSYTINKTFSVPSVSTAGQYYLIFNTNEHFYQSEINESNNIFALPINIDLNGPDLLVTSASAPATASVGSTITISWTVKNNGFATANSDWWDNIYLSSDSTYDYSDAYISSFSTADLTPLAAGSSYTLSKPVTIRSISSAGQYYLIVRTDSSSGQQAETNESNNSFSLPINIDLNGPDLQVTSASAPATASVGSSIALSWTVKNNGLATANGDWWDGIYLSSDPTYDYSDRFVSSFSAADPSPLAAGSSYTLNKTISAPSVSTAGQYYLILRTDLTGSQGETNESNNSFSVPISIDLNGPDLQVISASAPTTASVGSSIEISWTIKNNGLTAASSDWWDSIILSTDASEDYSDTFISSFSAADHSPLAAGGSYTFSKIVSVPSISTAGQYYLILRTDSSSIQGETSEDNNTFALPLSITNGIPSLPIITLEVAPEAGVTEDGNTNLIFIFSRTGATTSALTINVNIAGTASSSLGDYAQPDNFTTTSGYVTFPEGASTATVTIDPTPDPSTEADESIILTIAPGLGYTIGTAAVATAMIINDDTTIENKGNTTLLRRSDGLAFVAVGPIRQQVTAPWSVTAGGFADIWQMLGAETINGINTILWRHNPSSSLHTWSVDSNWRWISSSGLIDPNSSDGFNLEAAFESDFSGDSIIGTPFSTIEAQGNTKLLRRSDGKAVVEYGAAVRQEITSPWEITPGTDVSTWQMIAADTIGGTNQLLWRNNDANFLHTWTLDNTWSWQSSGGVDGFNTTEAWNLETSFQVDANRDSIIGTPFSTIEAQGNT
ncbi:MAG: CARDB domain-containing protein, partial [Cyanobium sp.]